MKNCLKSKLATALSLLVLTMCLMTGCGSDEIDEYRDDTAANMNTAVEKVDDAREVMDDVNNANDAATESLEGLE